MRLRTHALALRLIIAALAIGVVPCEAQVVPPAPPASPRQPRAPRSPRAWFGNSDNGGAGGMARIDTLVPFSANGTVELSLIAGSMKLSTWDRNQVRVVATTTGQPSLQFDASNSHVTLEQSSSGRHFGRDGDDVGSATYEVTVPAGSRATLSAVSGSIDASGLHGSVDVSNVSGAVDVRDLGSSLNVEGVSGSITAENIGNDAHIENVSGRVSLTGVGGSASAETVSGSILVAGVRGDRVHATSVSGNIDFAGPVISSGRYEFETHSGRAALKLGSNANAAISVETFSGSVTNDYAGAVRRRNFDPDDDRTNFDYVIGRGEGRVRVETFSGSVHVFQGNP
ncbi:MAG TPA: DUF4097 family beta strand repeat-containing protein [Gemmatimonadaceae bacterium]